MKTILITGAGGFIGRNLAANLQVNPNIRLLHFDIDNSDDDLNLYLQQADFVFHLAGVNRPQDVGEFQTGNADLTAKIVDLLTAARKNVPIVLTSSAQALLNNPYGLSKKQAENHIFAYGQQTGTPVYVYRLPGLFGKWSRPNYNSVVSTFCYNISHDLPVQINNPAYLLTLTYIDDVVKEFQATLNGEPHRDNEGFCFVPEMYQITLQQLSDTIQSFRESRLTAILPDMADSLTKYLYTTYLSYLDTNDFAYNASMKTDQRGWLFELIKSPHLGQVFVSQTRPGITRGEHYHHTKVEKFVVIQGQAVIRFRQIDGNNIIEYPVSGDAIQIVDIPPGYTHAITNTGNIDVITLFWANELFDSTRPDTYTLKV